jgi:hypothetical protein
VDGELLLLGGLCWGREATERATFLVVVVGHRGGSEGMGELDDARPPLFVGEFWGHGRVRDAGRHSVDAAKRLSTAGEEEGVVRRRGAIRRRRGGLRFKLRE